MSSSKVLELTLDPSQAIAYAQAKKSELEIALMERVDWFNQLLLARVQNNLGGQVLNFRTGNLFTSARRIPATNNGGEISGEVNAGGSQAPYGIYHELGGVQPYLIFANPRAALFFQMNGKNIFAKYVEHPAIKKRPWFQPAIDATITEIQPGLQQTVNEVLSDG